MSFDLAINNGEVFIYKNGELVLAPVHIGVRDKKIAAISDSPLEGFKIIDAKHLHVLPGVIDSQVHFREPGLTHKEDLESGTRAAALGGVTSVFEMPNTNPSTTTKENFLQKLELAKHRCWVNYAFFIGASPDNCDHIGDLEKIPGCCGTKIFMGSSTGNLLLEEDEFIERVLRSSHRTISVHAEDEARLRARKQIALDAQDVKTHHLWRDAESALKATQRVIALAKKTGHKVHILHVSTAEEVEFLKHHKDISTAEVLPNHLSFYAPDIYEKIGTLAQQNPPIREKRHNEALWQGLQSGVFDVIGSDHAPHTLEEKSKPYPSSPSGTPGVQTLVPVMLQYVHEQRLPLKKFVEMVTEGPRRVFGCLTKGRISLGMDADFTIIDLKKQMVIENSWIASKSAWTPFNGMKVTGWPTHTIIAGHAVMEENQLHGTPQGQPVSFQ